LGGCFAPVCERTLPCSLRDHDAPAVADVGVFAQSLPTAAPPRPDPTIAVAVRRPPPSQVGLRPPFDPLGKSHLRS